VASLQALAVQNKKQLRATIVLYHEFIKRWRI